MKILIAEDDKDLRKLHHAGREKPVRKAYITAYIAKNNSSCPCVLPAAFCFTDILHR